MSLLRTIPRKDRDLIRGLHAGNRVKAAGGTALAATLANIATSFDRAATINDHKTLVERILCAGYCNERVRARYCGRVDFIVRYRLDLDDACSWTQFAYANARYAFERDAKFNCRPIRLPMVVLDELRLILRWLRFKRLHADFTDMVRAIAAASAMPEVFCVEDAPPFAPAAE
jgi:hypothetical protein